MLWLLGWHGGPGIRPSVAPAMQNPLDEHTFSVLNPHDPHIIMTERKAMSLTLSEAEMDALEQLATRKDLSKTAVLRQALRLYQLVDERMMRGEKLFLEDEAARTKSELMLL